MAEPLGVGLIGCGTIGAAHALVEAAYRSPDKGESVALSGDLALARR